MPPSNEPDLGLARAVRDLRETRGITQEDLAHRAGVTWTTLARIERGKSNPTWGTLKRIAAALDVKVSELASRAER